MACPTCEHTMKQVGVIQGTIFPLFWCSRCGTIKANTQREYDDVPKLVERTRQLLDRTNNDDLAWSLGVTESVWRPTEERREASM